MKADYPTRQQFEAAAARIGCDGQSLEALAMVEAGPNGAFLDNGRPVILYEPHLFHRFTNGRFADARVPGVAEQWGVLSRPKWKPGTYGPVGVQHARLEAAAALDRSAALRACSWGLFQTLGDNFKRCGFAALQEFVNAINQDVAQHLLALVNFCLADPQLVRGLRTHSGALVGRRYNGPKYAEHGYDTRYNAAYAAAVKTWKGATA